jgi:hypothetical protein
VPVGKNLDRKCFTVHIARLPPQDICDVDTWPVTTPERTFLDIAASMDRERLVVVGDALLARQVTTVDDTPNSPHTVGSCCAREAATWPAEAPA